MSFKIRFKSPHTDCSSAQTKKAFTSFPQKKMMDLILETPFL